MSNSMISIHHHKVPDNHFNIYTTYFIKPTLAMTQTYSWFDNAALDGQSSRADKKNERGTLKGTKLLVRLCQIVTAICF